MRPKYMEVQCWLKNSEGRGWGSERTKVGESAERFPAGSLERPAPLEHGDDEGRENKSRTGNEWDHESTQKRQICTREVGKASSGRTCW